MKEILVEKYRPKEWAEVIGLNKEIIKHVENGNLPHMLFEGAPGGGKTAVAQLIIKKTGADVLLINASKDGKIDTLRDKIEPFAKKASDRLKIVFLDEFDDTSHKFQTALRNFMETHARSTRFIATCNYPSKILPPVLDRFTRYTFSKYNQEEIQTHLKKIIEKENIDITDENLKYLVIKYKDSIRGMINFLNKNKYKKIEKNDISYENTALKILAKLKHGKWLEIRAELLTQSIDYPALIEEIDKIVFYNANISIKIKEQVNELASKYQFEMYFSFSNEICFSAFMIEIQRAFLW